MPRSFIEFFKQHYYFIKYFIIIILITLILIEISLRVFFAFKIGPDVLWYGTRFNYGFGEEREWNKLVKERQSVAEHANKVKDYSKYFPYQKRFDYDPLSGEIFNVNINNQGFRGNDFLIHKKNNVLRIATLGGSSTFGYGNRDNETYPYFLEVILRARIMNDKRNHYNDVEVMNFGIPHLTSDKIFSLFINEVLLYQPDIIIFYEGINDAARNIGVSLGVLEIKKEKFYIIPLKKIKETLLTCAFVWQIGKSHRMYSYNYYKNQLNEKCIFFINNISKIKDICSMLNIEFIIMTQQAKSNAYDVSNLTYRAEADLLENKLTKTNVTPDELYFLFHNKLMFELKKWALENKVNIIDGIEILDNHRTCLTSWVHLNPSGNSILATAIADKICEIKLP